MKRLGVIVLAIVGVVLAAQKQTTLFYPPFGHTWGIHRGTEDKLDMLLGNVTDFDNPQGVAAVKLKSWDDPKSRKDDDEITCFGVNANRGQIIYNSSMHSLALYGKKGHGVGEFWDPRGICATPDGDVYVADMGNHRVVHLFMPKKELHWVGTIGDSVFEAPFDIAVVPGGTLYVTDNAKNCVVVIDTTGKVIAVWEGFYQPRGIDVDASTIRWSGAHQEVVVVVDSAGKAVKLLDRRTGKLINSVSMKSLGMHDADLQYVALDYLGNAYVPDSIRCQIHKFDNKLNYIVYVGECGTGDDQFDHPRGIDIWRRFGQVIISERSGAQYFWIGIDVKDFKFDFNPDERMISMSFFITEAAYVTVYIDGKKIDHKKIYRRRVPIGKRAVKVHIPDDVPPGKYKVTVVIEPTYSSYHYLNKEFKRKIKVR